MVVFDYNDQLRRPRNGIVIQRIDGPAFKEKTIRCLAK
jgi:hypothetical protein